MPSSALKNHVNINLDTASGVINSTESAANFMLSVNVSDISNYARTGDDLIITLKDGRNYEIKDFFAHGLHFNNLVLLGADGRYLVNFDAALTSEEGEDGILDPQVVYEKLEDSSSVKTLLAILGGAGAAGGVAAAVSDGDSDKDDDRHTPPPAKGGDSTVWDNTDTDNLIEIKPGDPTKDDTPLIKGEGRPGDTIIIKDGDEEIGRIVVGDDGKWDYELPPLADGDHEITISRENPENGASGEDEHITITIDTTAPDTQTPSVTARDKNNPDGGEVSLGNEGYINPADLTISGRSGDKGNADVKNGEGNTITIYDRGEKIGEAVVDANGEWSFQPKLGEGPHRITVVEKDRAGNVKTEKVTISDPENPGETWTEEWEIRSDPVDFVIDTQAPIPTITAVWDTTGGRTGNITDPDFDGVTDERFPMIEGVSGDDSAGAGHTIVIKINGEAVATTSVGNNGKWFINLKTALAGSAFSDGIPLGNVKITVEEIDRAGNTGTSSAVEFEVVDAGPDGRPAKPDVPDMVDDTDPDNEISIRSGDDTKDNTPKLKGEGGTPGNKIVIKDGGRKIGETEINEDGTWQWGTEDDWANAGMSGGLRDGWHDITVSEEDKAGNLSEPSDKIRINVDTEAPLVPIPPTIWDNGSADVPKDPAVEVKDGLTNDNTPLLKGKESEPGNTITIVIDGKEVGETVVNEDGTWEWGSEDEWVKAGFPDGLDDGWHEITVSEEDKAGNISEPSNKVEINIDTKAPSFGDIIVIDPEDPDNPVDITGENPSNVERPVIKFPGDEDAPPKFTDKDGNEIEGADGYPKWIRDGENEDGSDNGHWEWQPKDPLPEDEDGKIHISMEDPAGNTSEKDITINIDRTPPEAVAVLESISEDTGKDAHDFITSDTTLKYFIRVEGDLGEGETVWLKITDRTQGTDEWLQAVKDEASGKWIVDREANPLSDGRYEITTVVRDRAGNAGHENTQMITINTVRPDTPGGIIVVDPDDRDGGPIDADENHPTDNNKPIIVIPGDKENPPKITDKDGNEIAGGKDEEGNPYPKWVDGEDGGHWEWQPEGELDEGDNEIHISVEDPAGNESDDSVVHIVVDTKAPLSIAKLVSISEDTGTPGDFITADKTLEFFIKVDAIDDDGNSIAKLPDDETVQLRLIRENGRPVFHSRADEDGWANANYDAESGLWKFDFTNFTLNEGNYKIETRVVDAAGNKGEINNETVIIDTQIPSKLAWLTEISDDTGLDSSDFITNDRTLKFTLESDADPLKGETVWLRFLDENGELLPDLFGVNNEKLPAGIEIDKDGWIKATQASNGKWIVDFSEEGGTQFELPDGVYLIDAQVTSRTGIGSPRLRPQRIEINTAPDSDVPGIDAVLNDGVNAAGEKVADAPKEIKNGGSTNDTTPTLKGHWEGHGRGEEVIIYIDGRQVARVALKEDGSWSWTVPNDQPLVERDASYKITVSGVNKAGNEGAQSEPRELFIDTTKPDAPDGIIVIDPDDRDGGPIDADENHPTDNNKPIIVIPGDKENPPKITDKDGNEIAGGKDEEGNPYPKWVDGEDGGHWEWQPEGELDEGDNEIHISVEDPAGNESDDSVVHIVVDTEAPDVGIPTIWDNRKNDETDYTGVIRDGEKTNDDTPAFSGKGEPGNKVVIRDNGDVIGETTVDEKGNWTWTPDERHALDDGDHTIIIEETDKAGNTGKSDGITITVDTKPDSVPEIDISIDNVGDDDHTGDIIGKLGGLTNDTHPVFKGTGSLTSVVIIYDNGREIGRVKVDSKTGDWTWGSADDWAKGWSVGLADGKHSITVKSVNAAGNVSAESPAHEFVVDTTAPLTERPTIWDNKDNGSGADYVGEIRNNGITNDDTPTFKGTSGDKGVAGLKNGEGNVITITITSRNNPENTITRTATVDKDGYWEWIPDRSLADDDYTVSVVETDKAGNESFRTQSVDFTVDTTDPAALVKVVGVILPGTSAPRTDFKAMSGDLTYYIELDDETVGLEGDEFVQLRIVGKDGQPLDGYDWVYAPGSNENGWRAEVKGLKTGDYQIEVRVIDRAGNVRDGYGHDLTVNLGEDLGKPTFSVWNDFDTPGGGGEEITDKSTTNDDTPTFRGMDTSASHEGHTITLHWKDQKTGNDREIRGVRVKEDGSWEWTAAGWANGNYEVWAEVVDAFGNRKTSDHMSFEIAREFLSHTAQLESITEDRGFDDATRHDFKTNDNTLKFTMTSDADADRGETVYLRFTDENGALLPDLVSQLVKAGVTVDRGGWIAATKDPASGKWIVDLSGENGAVEFELPEGKYLVDTIVRDGIGNTGRRYTQRVEVDMTAPDVWDEGSEGAISAWDNVGFIQGEIKNKGMTDDTTPTFRGKGEIGNSVTITVTGDNGQTETKTLIVDRRGNWEWTPENSLAEDHYTVTVSETDKAGNTADQPGMEFTVDTTPPTGTVWLERIDTDTENSHLPGTDHDFVTSHRQPKLIFEVQDLEEGVSVWVRIVADDGKGTPVTEWLEVSRGRDGYVMSTPVILEQGKYRVEMLLADEAGNVAYQPSHDLEIDYIAPVQPVIDGIWDDKPHGIGYLHDGDVTNDDTLTFNGKGEAGSVIIIRNGATELGYTIAGPNGTWTWTVPEGVIQESGHYKFNVVSVDKAGNESPESDLWDIEIDLSVPEAMAEVVSFSEDTGIGADDDASRHDGVTSDNGLVYFIKIDETAGLLKETDTVWLHITGTDTKGNPVEKWVQADQGKGYNSGFWTVNQTRAADLLRDGDYHVSAEVRSKGGNGSGESRGMDITIDTVAPENTGYVTIDHIYSNELTDTGDPDNSQWKAFNDGDLINDATPRLRGTIKLDGEWQEGDYITIKEAGRNGKVYGKATLTGETGANGEVVWEFEFIGHGINLQTGSHRLEAVLTDLAGNLSPDVRAGFGVDIIIKGWDSAGEITGAIADGDVTDDTRLIISGAAEANGEVTIIVTGPDGRPRPPDTVRVSADGHWEWRPNPPLSGDGNYKVNIKGKGISGTRPDGSVDFHFTLDTTPPEFETRLDAINEDTGFDDHDFHTSDADLILDIKITAKAVKQDDGTIIYEDYKPGDIVRVVISGGNLKKPIDLTGNITGWDYTKHEGHVKLPTGVLGDGNYTVVSWVQDKAGNKSGESKSGFTIDTQNLESGDVSITGYRDNVGEIQGDIDFEDGRSLTDDRTPEIYGKVDDLPRWLEEAWVHLSWKGPRNQGGEAWIKVSGNGEWRYQFKESDALIDGDWTLHARLENAAGGPSNGKDATVQLEVDGTVPLTPVIIGIFDDEDHYTGEVNEDLDGLTNDPTLTISGTSSNEGVTIVIYDTVDGIRTQIAEAIVVNGRWSVTLTEGTLEDGEHSITAVARTRGGSESAATEAHNFLLDTSAPDATATFVGVLDKEWGLVREGVFVTNDERPMLVFELSRPVEAEEVIFVHVIIGGKDYEFVAGAVSGSTIARAVMPSGIPWKEGHYEVITEVRDKAGNSVPRQQHDLEFDITPPPVPALDTVWDDVGNTRGIDYGGFDNPTGNILDTGKPDGINYTNDSSPTFGGTAEPGTFVDIYIDGSLAFLRIEVDENGQWSFKIPTSYLNDGRYIIAVGGRDLAGNKSEVGQSWILEVDTVVPNTASFSKLGAGNDTGWDTNDLVTSKNNPAILLNANINADRGETLYVRLVEVDKGGNPVGASGAWIEAESTGADNSWEDAWMARPSNALKDGLYRIETITIDRAGNTRGVQIQSRWILEIDTVAPDAPQIDGASTDGAIHTNRDFTVSGTAEAGSRVTLYDENGRSLGDPVRVRDDGKWTMQVHLSADGDYKLYARAEDRAGNVGEQSESAFEVHYDTRAPDTPELVSVIDDVASDILHEDAEVDVKDIHLTNDRTLTFHGISDRSEAGGTVIIRIGRVEIGRGTVGEDGAWTVDTDIPGSISDGSWDVAISVTDKAGNISSALYWKVELDTTAPDAPAVTVTVETVDGEDITITEGVETRTDKPVLSGRTEDGAVVVIYDNGTEIGRVIADGTGLWRWTPEKGLDEGKHKLTVSATDKAGNTSIATDIPSFTVDITAPDAASKITSITDDNGVAGDFVTNDRTLIINGQVEGTLQPGDMVQIRIDGGAWQNVTMGENGAWIFDNQAHELADGRHVLETRVVDKAGNFRTPYEQAVEINTDMPDRPGADDIRAWDNVGANGEELVGDAREVIEHKGTITNDTTPILEGSNGIIGGQVTIYDENGKLLATVDVKADGTWSWGTEEDWAKAGFPEGLADGGHKLVIRNVGRGGVESAGGVEFDFVVDTANPGKPASAPQAWDDHGSITGDIMTDLDGLTDDATPTVKGNAGTGKAGWTITIYDGDNVIGTTRVEADGTWAWTPQDAPGSRFGDGKHEISFTETNKAGVTGERSDSIVFEVDTGAPQALLVQVIDDEGLKTGIVPVLPGKTVETDDTTPTFQGRLSNRDGHGGETVTITIKDENGKVVAEGTVAVRADGTWEWTPQELAEGNYEVNVRATDKAGNTEAAGDTARLSISSASSTDNWAILEKITDDTGRYDNDFITREHQLVYYVKPHEELKQGETIWLRILDKDGNPLDLPGAKAAGWVQVTETKGGHYNIRFDGYELADGAYTVQTAIADMLGRLPKEPREQKLIVDSAAPDAPDADDIKAWDNVDENGNELVGDDREKIDHEGTVTNDDTPIFEGVNGDPEGQVAIYVDGRGPVFVNVNADGSWGWGTEQDWRNSGLPGLVNGKLTDGRHVVVVRNVDGAGNISDTGVEYDFVVDTKAPDAVSTITGITDDTGTDSHDFITNDADGLIIHGELNQKLAAGETVQINLDDGKGWRTVTLNEDGLTWSFGEDENGDPVLVGEGVWNVRTRVVDQAGNLGRETAQTIIVDTTGPGKGEGENENGHLTHQVTITHITDDSDPDNVVDRPKGEGAIDTGDHTPTLHGTLIWQDMTSGDWIAIYATRKDGERVLLGKAVISEDGASWSFTPPEDMDFGDYHLEVVLMDVAGNEGVSDSIDITIATNPVNVAVIDSISDDTGTDSHDFLTSDNTLIIHAKVKDMAGNDLGADGLDERHGDFVEIRISGRNGTDSGWQKAVWNAENKTWDLDYTRVTLQDGDYTLESRISNKYGTHSDADRQALEVDTVAPTLDSIEITGYVDAIDLPNGKGIADAKTHEAVISSGGITDDRYGTLRGTFSGALAPDAILVLYDKAGVRFGEVEIDNTRRSWLYRFGEGKNPVLDNNSEHDFFVQVEDYAGNIGNASTAFNLHVSVAISVETVTVANNTPWLRGDVDFDPRHGEYVEIVVRDKAGTVRETYRSDQMDDQFHIVDGRWGVQVRKEANLEDGSYEVEAYLKDKSGKLIAQDNTSDELNIERMPEISIGVSDTVAGQTATAVTMDEHGNWMIMSNQYVFIQNATNNSDLGNFTSIQLEVPRYGLGRREYAVSATWMDYDRNGRMDLFANDSWYGNGQQAHINLGNGRFEAGQIGGPRNGGYTHVYWGGIVAFDKTGGGYLSLAYGDALAGDTDTNGGANADSQIAISRRGDGFDGLNATGDAFTGSAWDSFRNDKNYAQQPTGSDPWFDPARGNFGNSQMDRELSTIDLDNNGTVDLLFHGSTYYYNGAAGGSKIGGKNNRPTNSTRGTEDWSTGRYNLVFASNEGGHDWNTKQVVEDVFLNTYISEPQANNISMTWADFDGDGYMDLYMGMGYGIGGHSVWEGRILFNDGHGRITSTKPNAVGEAGDKIAWMGETHASGPSIALDWDHDGRMDIIELPSLGARGGVSTADQRGPITLYRNKGDGFLANGMFETSNLLGGNNTIGSNDDFVTGVAAIDVNWDGARDLMVFTSKGNTRIIMGDAVEDGTSLHFKLLDQGGINALMGNTVQLYDSKGKLVSSQIINPQSGNGTNDSTGIVDFYGLDANEEYDLLLLRNVDGQSVHIGGRAGLGDREDILVNKGWHGFKAGPAYEAHVLTAELGDGVAASPKPVTIVGTGYNDVFLATAGGKVYNGAGGTIDIDGDRQWSDTGGQDIVDFMLAGDRDLTVDLNRSTSQVFTRDGQYHGTLLDIEGLYGGNGNDVFIGNSRDNVFNGRGGDDIFHLGKGGHTVLLYELLDDAEEADSTGGNGHDTAYGFHVGFFEVDRDADRIDLSDLLKGRGVNADNVSEYLKAESDGHGNTVISIDLDGAGGDFSSQALLTLNGVDVDLQTLLSNHQIII
ncbi:MAG: Putative extracellular protein [Candidatus Tokpelaia hoelldobleri]|uniref:Extracellular protein n=1 Tax=Candidatus Tokpelaia hoelldobleri TaxID=1902579 RepID=A0A1U9JVP1_9HYPH|nr:MAG: Putative extracellular protein [Candidatus Tokpelaia hoelldoblerii]